MAIIEDKDFYTLLGVTPRATQAEIKQAYRALARKYHPDVEGNADTEEIFRKITAAFKILSDSEKRNDYNKQHGFEYADHSQEDRQEELRSAAEKDKKVEVSGGINAERVFRELRSRADAADLKIGHKVSMIPDEEMARHGEEPDDGEVMPWGEAEGVPETESGGRDAGLFGGLLNRLGVRRRKTGANKERMRQQLKDFSTPLAATEASVKKKRKSRTDLGTLIQNPTDPFRGERIFNFQISEVEAAMGTVREMAMQGLREETGPAKVRVKIPPGIKGSATLEVARGWDRVKVKVTVYEDPALRLEEQDIVLRLPLSLAEAVEGLSVEVPTIDGPKRVQIPAMTETFAKVRLPGLGLTEGEPGDMVIEPYIMPPDQISETVRQAVKVLETCYQQPFPRDVQGWREERGKQVLYLPLMLSEALFGAKIAVSGPSGPIQAEIPRGWRGSPIEAAPGMLIIPVISPPGSLTPEAKAACSAIGQHYLADPRESVPRRLVQ